MSLRLILAVSTALVATPVLAQTAPPAPPPAAAAPAPSPEEAAMEAKGEAFQAAMEAIGAELEAVMSDSAKDNAAKTAETNAIIDRHGPEIEAFAADLETFLRAMADNPANAARRDEIVNAANAAPAAIRSIPAQMRAGVAQALTAAPAAPAQAQ
jgi:hypothetical protein